MAEETRLPIITLTTDFGTRDHYVGALKAAILSVSTSVLIVDITHSVPAHDLREAGWILRNVYGTFPRGTVHIAVADPGVGTDRRSILAVTENHFFVGPDNGIFSFVFEAEPPSRVIEIASEHYLRSFISPTFHARDIFAPVAAHVARGADPANLGQVVDDFRQLELPRAKMTKDGIVRVPVAHVDRFGNVILNVTRSALEAVLRKLDAQQVAAVTRKARVERFANTYGESPPGQPFLLYNSADFLEIAANRARVCDLLGLRPADVVDLVPRRP